MYPLMLSVVEVCATADGGYREMKKVLLLTMFALVSSNAFGMGFFPASSSSTKSELEAELSGDYALLSEDDALLSWRQRKELEKLLKIEDADLSFENYIALIELAKGNDLLSNRAAKKIIAGLAADRKNNVAVLTALLLRSGVTQSDLVGMNLEGKQATAKAKMGALERKVVSGVGKSLKEQVVSGGD